MPDKKTTPVKENILVIQKDLSERRIMQLAFNEKYILYFARDVDVAVRIGRNFPCKVVIFDAGSATASIISELSWFKTANSMENPIILLASNNSFEIESSIAGIGVFYHLVRPFSVKHLDELIQAALHYWQRTFDWTKTGDKS